MSSICHRVVLRILCDIPYIMFYKVSPRFLLNVFVFCGPLTAKSLIFTWFHIKPRNWNEGLFWLNLAPYTCLFLQSTLSWVPSLVSWLKRRFRSVSDSKYRRQQICITHKQRETSLILSQKLRRKGEIFWIIKTGQKSKTYSVNLWDLATRWLQSVCAQKLQAVKRVHSTVLSKQVSK